MKNSIKNTMIATAATIALLGGTVAIAADTKNVSDQAIDKQQEMVKNKATKMLKDDAYVMLSGTVGKIVDGDEFELKYSDQSIMVDTNDQWPNVFQADADTILKMGDKVIVTGKVDDNFLTAKEIDATAITHINQEYSRVYNSPENRGVYAATMDSYDSNIIEEGDMLKVTGMVTEVMDDEFMLQYGTGEIEIDTDDINFSEMDGIRKGDRVTVYGELDEEWFGNNEIDATSIYRTTSYGKLAIKN